MIEIKDSKELGYSTECPALTVTHTMNAQHIEEVIRLAVKYRGAGFVMAAAGLNTVVQRRTPAYVCFVEGGECPRYVHSTRKSAEEEAVRLARKTGRNVMVLAQVSVVQEVSEPTYTKKLKVFDCDGFQREGELR